MISSLRSLRLGVKTFSRKDAKFAKLISYFAVLATPDKAGQVWSEKNYF
jgi:hypothetical protein